VAAFDQLHRDLIKENTMNLKTMLATLCALTIAHLASAHCGVIAHKHIKYKSVKSSWVVTIEGGYALVEWEASYNQPSAGRFDPVKNTLIITLLDDEPPKGKPMTADVTLSLFSLGAQAIGHDLQIRKAKARALDGSEIADGAKFADAGEAAATAKTEFYVRRTGVTVPDPKKPKDEAVNGDKICFVSFNGAKCEMEVEAANLKHIGVTTWWDGSYGEGHDNQPPENPPQ
jgi:hypothetical protein